MRKLNTTIAASVVLACSVLNSAIADDKAIVQAFYDFLSNPASDSHATAFANAITDNWQSIGDYSGKTKTKDQFIGQVGGFAKLIPDLNWHVQEMIQEGNRIVVRSRASGTPAGPLFDIDGKGKSFDILTIDIHTVDNSAIVKTWHVEDWAGALQQLRGQ